MPLHDGEVFRPLRKAVLFPVPLNRLRRVRFKAVQMDVKRRAPLGPGIVQGAKELRLVELKHQHAIALHAQVIEVSNQVEAVAPAREGAAGA